MILVLAGTQDGRELAALLVQQGYQVMATVVSQYGKVLTKLDNLAVHDRPLDIDGLTDLIKQQGIRLVVDATHPYAVNVSRNAMTVCDILSVGYLRYERPAVALPQYEGLYVVEDYQQAAKTAAGLGNVIFLTTGSRMLNVFKAEPKLMQHRLIARVLPDPDVIRHCLQLGFTPRDILALQGPFSQELNMALFKAYEAEVIIMKNSGVVGGSDTKLAAAMALNIPIVVIDRPKLEYKRVVGSSREALIIIKEVFQ